MFFTPGTHLEAGLTHNPLNAIVSPRPIGWISTRGKDGSLNLAPYSFFNAVSEQPPMVMFSSSPKNDTSKDSLRNVLETQEFVVNIVSSRLSSEMNISSGNFHYDVNEFEEASLEMAKSQTISVPRVKEAPAALECALWRVIDLPMPEKEQPTKIVFGSISGIHIAEEMIVNGKVDVTKYQPLARLGYMDYAKIIDVFTMQRPKV